MPAKVNATAVVNAAKRVSGTPNKVLAFPAAMTHEKYANPFKTFGNFSMLTRPKPPLASILKTNSTIHGKRKPEATADKISKAVTVVLGVLIFLPPISVIQPTRIAYA